MKRLKKLIPYALILILTPIVYLITRDQKTTLIDWKTTASRQAPIGGVKIYLNDKDFEILTTALSTRITARGTYEIKNDSIYLLDTLSSPDYTEILVFPKEFEMRYGKMRKR